MKIRTSRPIRFVLDTLESRVVPTFAAWPIAGGPAAAPVIGTYGQYQDIKAGDWDKFVHFHEGLDIGAPKGTVVRAVASGKVIGVYPGDISYRSAIIIQDLHSNKK